MQNRYEANRREAQQDLQVIAINNNLHFFKPYKSWSDLGQHIHAHLMVILPVAFIAMFPLIAVLLPVAWFFLFMRTQAAEADRIMINLVSKLASDLLQLVTVPFRCLSTLVLGVATNGAENTVKAIGNQLKSLNPPAVPSRVIERNL